jgi:hypothetical protein
VLVDGEALAANAVVIAMGPWSSAAAKWLPLPPTTGQKYHSVVLRPARRQPQVAGDCLFTSFTGADGGLPAAAGQAPAGPLLLLLLLLLLLQLPARWRARSSGSSPAPGAPACQQSPRPRPPLTAGRHTEPEVYPRPDGTVYACGEPQALPVPGAPGGVNVEPRLCGGITEVAASLSSALQGAKVGRRMRRPPAPPSAAQRRLPGALAWGLDPEGVKD